QLLRSAVAVTVVVSTAAAAASPQALANARDMPPPASVLARRTDLRVHDVDLPTALTRLAERSGVPAAFSPSLAWAVGGHVSCDCVDLSVREALDQLLSSTEFGYSEQKGQVVVFLRPSPLPLSDRH